MLIRTGMGTQLSGSVGGVVASRNAGGMYLRNRTVPVNPNSAAQSDVRTEFSNAAIGWAGLTAGQRTGWEGYAAGTPVVNRLGETITLSGFNWYVAYNSFLVRSGGSVANDAPGTPGLEPFVTNPVTTLSAANGITLANIPADLDGPYVVRLSPPLSPGVTFFGGPYSAYLVGTDMGGDAGANAPNVSPLRYGALVSGQRRAFATRGYSDTNSKLTGVVTGFLTVGA